MNHPRLRAVFAVGAIAVALVFTRTAAAAIHLNDRQDLLIHSDSDSAFGAEPSIAVHPDDWKTLVISLIASGGSTTGCAGWISTDGGLHWVGNNEPAHTPGNGDPIVAIRKGSPTRYFILSLASAESDSTNPEEEGQRVVWTESTSSTTWPDQQLVSEGGVLTDKGYLCAENASGVDESGNLYCAWYVPSNDGLRFRYSSDGGATWIPSTPIPLKTSGFTWGAVIATAIDATNLAHVYVAWPQSTDVSAATSVIYFRRSATGGASFGAEKTAVNLNNSGYKIHTELGNHSRANATSAPSMATDEQGNIYVAWCQKRDGTADAHLYVSKSSDEGDTWSTRVAVTASTDNQWQPWIAWDREANALVAVYFDDRANDDSTQVYLAASYDRGSTFTEMKVSDWQGSGDVFVGDYISVASGGGVAYPVWCDDRDGRVKAYTSPVLVGGIDSSTITSIVGQNCASTGNPRVRFEVDWSTLVAMDGTDKLTVTPPGGSPQVASAASTGTSHTLVLYDLPCVNGTWTFTIESNKGAAVSKSGTLTKSVTCISCPPPCNPPCELD